MVNQKNNKQFRWSKFFIVLAIALFTVICISIAAFIYLADKIAIKYLPELVYEKTNNNYRFAFDSINIDFRKKEIELNRLSVVPDTLASNDTISTQYFFNSERVVLSGLKYRNLLFFRQLRFNKIDIVDPELRLKTGKEVKIDQLSFAPLQKGDTLNLPFFSEIFIDSIFVHNAQLNLNLLNEITNEAPNINIELNHFKLGGIKFTDYPFPFDVSDILLNVEKYSDVLPDSLHQISIDKISFSIFKSNIIAQNVFLSPIADTLNNDNRYTVSMPRMLLEAPNLGQIFISDTIAIDLMEITQPHIEIKFGTRVSQGTPLNEINLYQLVEKRLRWVKIDRFSIKQANVLLTPSNSENVAQKFQNLDIDFFGFYGDSVSYKNTERIFSASDFSIKLELFTLYHVDNVHQLNISNIVANSKNNHLSTKSIIFKPLAQANLSKVNTLIDTKSAGLEFIGVDFHQMYHNQLIPMSELIINEPKISIGFNRKVINTSKHKSKSLILEKTKDYLKGIYVDKTTIRNGSLQYNYLTGNDNRGFFHSNFNFSLSQLSVDSVTFYQTDKIFFADHFELGFNDIGLQLANESHQLTIDSLSLSSIGQRASVFNLKLTPIENSTAQLNDQHDNSSEKFNFYFPRIELSGANLHRAFFYKELYIHTFNIYNPVLNFEKYGEWNEEENINQVNANNIYDLISDYMKSISIRNLNMIDGKLNILQLKNDQSEFTLSNDFSIKMYNFKIDKHSASNNDKLFFSDDIDLVLKKHSFTLADDVHRVDANEIGILTTQNKVYIKNAKLYPIVLSEHFEEMPLTIFAEIPEINISDADVFSLLKKGILPVSQVVISNPTIKLLLNQSNSTKNAKNETKPNFLLKELKSISAKNISITNGKLELAKYENQRSVTYANTMVDFELDQLSITRNNESFSTTYNNVKLNLSNLHFDLSDNIHGFDIQNANYNLIAKTLNINNITLKPKNNIDLNARNLLIDINIPQISITDFELKQFIENNSLELNSVTINKPALAVTDNRIEKQNVVSLYQLDLYPAIKTFAQQITTNRIIVNDASINLKKAKQLKLENINLVAENFIINEQNSNRDKLLNSEKVKINLTNLSGKTKNGYFKYQIDTLELDHNGVFALNNISLVPVHSKKKFADLNRYQADYFMVHPAKIWGNGLDVKSLIESGDISLNQLYIDFDNVSIHRDKTYPLHPDQRPKMPQQAIRDLKQKLSINEATIKFNKFEYTELEPKAKDTSYVFFTNGMINVSNITNLSQLLNTNPIMKSTIEAKLMNIGETTLNINWDVRSFGNDFTFEGNVRKMPLNVLNPITEPGLKMSVKEGTNQRMEVLFKANEDSAVGSMRFAYNDLKISVLSNRDGELREDKFLSFIVNSMALKSDNPKPGRILLPSRFVNYRDKQRSVIGYCWQSVYSGIKSTFGIKDKEKEKTESE